MAGDLRLGKRALQGSPGLLEQLRDRGAGTAAAQFRMGTKLRHPERYDDHGHLKADAGPKPTGNVMAKFGVPFASQAALDAAEELGLTTLGDFTGHDSGKTGFTVAQVRELAKVKKGSDE